MAHSYTNLLYHLVFATKGRQQWIDIDLRPKLFAYLGSVLHDEDAIAITINGMAEHVHILAKLRPTHSVSKILEAIKSRSSAWIHRSRSDLAAFAWQTGYGAFTVSFSQVDRVRAYIDNQERHHATLAYDSEFRAFLRRNGITMTEEEMWE